MSELPHDSSELLERLRRFQPKEDPQDARILARIAEIADTASSTTFTLADANKSYAQSTRQIQERQLFTAPEIRHKFALNEPLAAKPIDPKQPL